MKPTLKNVLILIVLVNLFSCSSSNDVSDSELQLDLKQITTKRIEIEIIENINAYRIGKGLGVLKTIPIVKKVANNHTNFMIKDGSITHKNFSERSKFLIKNTKANRVGENIAYGYRNANSLVKAWINSDSHRETMEGDFNYCDISAEQNEQGVWFYTNIFIKK